MTMPPKNPHDLTDEEQEALDNARATLSTLSPEVADILAPVILSDGTDDPSALVASTFSRILAETTPAPSALDAGIRDRMASMVEALEAR